jgi:hypothetical protein
MWTFTLPAAMILITLVIFLVGVLVWRKCCRTENEPLMPRTSAPPMLMPGLTHKATKSNAAIPIRVTRLGDFSPIRPLFVGSLKK